MKYYFLLLSICFSLCASAQQVMKKLDKNTYVVNTTELCKARGYKSYTPLEVHIRNGKVIDIVALPNRETPKYFHIAKTALFAQYKDKKVAKALAQAKQPKVDGCTGATLSAKALQQNIKAALDYYNKNK